MSQNIRTGEGKEYRLIGEIVEELEALEEEAAQTNMALKSILIALPILPMPWSSIEFPESIRRTKVGRENQILSADIQPSGRFPVVDQGQAFIAGYSDAEERVIQDDLPMVIFGDHTRCVKYVDFPFILGADGTKVLKPKEDLFDPKFSTTRYWCLKDVDTFRSSPPN